jgi:hypothetical protein
MRLLIQLSSAGVLTTSDLAGMLCLLFEMQLEEEIRQAQEQKQHVAVQLEQLEGCESSRDNLGISDLRAQLQVGRLGNNMPSCKCDSGSSPCHDSLVRCNSVSKAEQ